jgi:pyruvate formate lyase activating enzyme
MEQVGRYMTVGEVVEEVEKDVPFYMNSGGGMTISGGEPLFQYNFVREVFRQCKEKNIHTALDTSGYAEWDVMREVLPYVDLLLYDIKHMDAEMHTEGVGKPNDLIIDNARRIAGKVRTWLRFPVIPQYNDSYPNVERVAQFASDLKVEKVSLLPYHNWGEQKYGRLGRRYPAEGTPVPDEDHMQELKKIVESYGLNVTIGR